MPGRSRFRAVGLRWQIVGWATVVMVVCLAVAFVAVYRGTGDHLRAQIDGQLGADVAKLTRATVHAGGRSEHRLAAAATLYIKGRPFSATSTLLFVRFPGQPASTNRPELFRHSAPDNGETRAEQQNENHLSEALASAGVGYATLPLPDVGDLRLLIRSINVTGETGRPMRLLVGAGQPLATVSDAEQGVARAFILAGILAVLGVILGALLLGTRTSRPLRSMATVAERVDGGDLHPRIHIGGRAAIEVDVLARSFNRMLDRLAGAFASQRDFVADASHELRTPLTVIRGQVEVLAENPAPSPEQVRRVEGLLLEEVSRIDRLVEDLLLLTEVEQADLLQIQPIELKPFLESLWEGTILIAERDFELLVPLPGGVIEADSDRLTQALRNLLTNAIKHTAEPDGKVSMCCEQTTAGGVVFTIEDDGPGIAADERERVFERFHRTDPARDRASGGAGLGLAIVAAIARAHGGTVEARDSRFGGALLVLQIPAHPR